MKKSVVAQFPLSIFVSREEPEGEEPYYLVRDNLADVADGCPVAVYGRLEEGAVSHKTEFVSK